MSYRVLACRMHVLTVLRPLLPCLRPLRIVVAVCWHQVHQASAGAVALLLLPMKEM
jgi:hypothetical protein